MRTAPQDARAAEAATLPQADASTLVDAGELEAKVKEMYGRVAREEEAELHFEVGRRVAERVGYPRRCSTRSRPRRSRRSPASAITSTSRRSSPARACSTSAPARAPTCSARPPSSARPAASSASTSRASSWPRPSGCATATASCRRASSRRPSTALPFEDGTFDAVISNGVINLSVAKQRVFAEAARVLRPGGRLVVADIVSGKPLKERTRRNVELWAACIAGAIPRTSYLEAIEAAGLVVGEVRRNDYGFVSERALDACSTYEVQSISLVAVKPG